MGPSADWYAALVRPPLTPPNWIFGPVWTVLYILIALSIFLYLRTPEKPGWRVTVPVLLVHLGTNFAWTGLFFGLQSPGLALIDLLVLDCTLVVLLQRFHRVRPLAAKLLLPYLAWVGFATYLNAGFLWLNAG